MSHIYVLALTSHNYPSLVVDERRVEFIRIDKVFAAVERRAAPPVVSEAELRSQHDVVNAIFKQTDDLLPVRFGAWIDRDELSKVINRQQESIRDALQLVRGRTQMTIRFLAPPAVRAEDQQSRRYPETGTEYLRTRREAQHWMPDEAIALKAAVRDLVVAERVSPRSEAAGSLTRVKLGPVASLYHLISRDAVTAYGAATLPFRNATITVSGPWAPFAFAPDPWL
jgi:hypothetical protein